MNYVIRAAKPGDLQSIYEMAKLTGGGFTNLPPDRQALHAKLERAAAGFASEKEYPGDELYLMVLEEIVAMAEERQHAINADHPRVQEFWETYDYIESRSDDQAILNHSRDEHLIAINLNEFVAKADALRQQIPEMNEIKKLLRTSRTRKFCDVKTVNSALRSNSIKCWVFQREKASNRTTD